MPSIINSDDGVVSGSSGLKTTGGNDGILALQNNGTTNVTVTAAGNVGIGTSSPNTRLQINSTANTASNNIAWDSTGATLTAVFNGTSAADAGASIAFNDQGTAGLAAIKGAREATSGNGYLSFLTRSGSGGQYATERARITSGGDFQFNSGYGSVATAYGCRAWVNFNGTGTVAIRASGNVTSITDNGTGIYTVNFTTAMPDANYCVVSGANNGYPLGILDASSGGANPTTSAVRIISFLTTATDVPYVCVAIFR